MAKAPQTQSVLAPDKASLTEFRLAGVESRLNEPHNKGGYRVVESDIAAIAKFYDSTNTAWANKSQTELQTDSKSKWVNRGFKSIAEAREFCRDYTIPPELAHQAKVLSREMVAELLQSGGVPRLLRRQQAGRFDVGALPRVLTSAARGDADLSMVRPFKNREKVNPSRPHVGIVADGSWRQFWGDTDYCARVGSLLLGIGWACETVGCPVTGAISRGSYFSGGGTYGYYDMMVNTVFTSGQPTNTADLSVILHPELYRVGDGNVCCNNPASAAVKWDCDPDQAASKDASSVWGDASADGGKGVAYLKAKGCTITVAIGTVLDADQATVHIGATDSLEDAVRKIAQTLAQQNKSRFMAA